MAVNVSGWRGNMAPVRRWGSDSWFKWETRSDRSTAVRAARVPDVETRAITFTGYGRILMALKKSARGSQARQPLDRVRLPFECGAGMRKMPRAADNGPESAARTISTDPDVMERYGNFTRSTSNFAAAGHQIQPEAMPTDCSASPRRTSSSNDHRQVSVPTD